ncbi:glycoside hydrolase family 25 protein [Streptomyces sp. 4N509B]|uniref:glycoside hydrolase family 25 protein n=1 Tax=Streptomyces sp. 4N509B TaxID=3457413 RepID=UPI003FCFA88C
MTIKGIDVSGYQSETYPLDGFDFVIVKATEGTSYVNPRHAAQVRRARDHNRVVGHYHYLSSGSGIAAQMDYFLDHAGAREGEVLAVDWEESGVSSDEKDSAIRRLKDKAGGRKVLLYCNTNFWLNHDTSSFAGDGLWIAHYGVGAGKPGIKDPWLIHQYTDDPIDTNVARFDSRSDMAAWAAGDAAGDEEERPRRNLYDAQGLTRTVPARAWTTVRFSRRYEDGDWTEKSDPTGIVYGPCHYSASLGLRVTGLPRGAELRVRLANYREKDDGSGDFERTVAMPSHSPVQAGGDLHVVHTWTGYVPGAGRGRLRAEVRHDHEGGEGESVTIDFARAETLYWPA